MADRAEFDEFVAARSPHLLRLAYLLTRNVSTSQDLLQDAFLKSWFAWPRITADPEPYVRKVLVTSYVSGLRRMWRRELPSDFLPEGRHADQTETANTTPSPNTALRSVIVPPWHPCLVRGRYPGEAGKSIASLYTPASGSRSARLAQAITPAHSAAIFAASSSTPGHSVA